MNRQQLIDYIKKNSFFYSGALFYCFSNEQLFQLKTRIEQKKKKEYKRKILEKEKHQNLFI